MANGEQAEAGGSSPVWYAVGALVLVILFMAALISFKPLDFSPPKAPACEGAACEHESAAPEGTSREAPPASGEHAPPASAEHPQEH